jgi:nucleotide-binding universal stress UspA family protein
MGKIVVGTDGSACSEDALRWAAHQAELVHGDLEVVYGWLLPYAEADITGLAIGACEQSGEQILREATAFLRDVAPTVPGRTVLVASHPAAALIERSADAELVVVGSRGRGGFAGALLGSVSTQVVHHAHCPVVVVRR